MTIHVSAADTSLFGSAEVFAADLSGICGAPPAVVRSAGCAEPAAGDVELRVDGRIGPAARVHRIRVDARGVLTVTGADAAGTFHGTRTVLQLLAATGCVGSDIDDAPEYPQRGVMLDVARKHFSPGWIERLIARMANRKLNVLQLHLSDGLGFRAPSLRHPEIVSEPHLSTAEIRRLTRVAAAHQVALVPDVDTPAHLDHILAAHPEWRLRLADGTVLPSHLDYSIPEARAFVADLVAEVADLFGSPWLHLGGDEYFPAPWQAGDRAIVTAASAPQLVAFARERHGDAAGIVDGYIAYLDDLVRMLAARGITAKVWSDDLDPAPGRAQLPRSVEVHSWIRWNRERPGADELAAAGHPLVNANGDYLYFILAEDGVGRGPTKNPRGIYERWTPRVFMGAAGNGGDLVLPADAPVAGAHLSVWCDHPDVMDEDEIAARLDPWLDAFAQKAWGTASDLDYEAFAAAARAVSP